MNAIKATVVVTGNTVKNCQGTAFIVKESQEPAHAYGNSATSADPHAKAVDIQGGSGIVENKLLKNE